MAPSTRKSKKEKQDTSKKSHCKMPYTRKSYTNPNITSYKQFENAMTQYNKTISKSAFDRYQRAIDEYKASDVTLSSKVRPLEKQLGIPSVLKYISGKTCAQKSRDSTKNRRNRVFSRSLTTRKKWSTLKRKCFMKSPIGTHRASRKGKYCVKRKTSAKQWAKSSPKKVRRVPVGSPSARTPPALKRKKSRLGGKHVVPKAAITPRKKSKRRVTFSKDKKNRK